MEDTTPTGPRRSTRKAGLVGGALGSLGLAVSVFALSATAGAAGPVLQADTEPAPTEILAEAAEGELELDDADFAAADACWDELDATFAFDGDADIDEDAIDWDALEAASQECEALLPQEVQDEIAAEEEAWAPYEACIDGVLEAEGIDWEDAEVVEFDVDLDDEFDDEFDGEIMDFGPAVSIMDGDDVSFAEFGEGDGTITIVKSGDDITVSTDGDVNVETIDWDDEAMMLDGEFAIDGDFAIDAELDEAFSACDDQLPEGIDFEDGDFEDGFVVAGEVEPLELTEG